MGGDLLVSGGVQAPSDKLRSSYSVMSKWQSGLRMSALRDLMRIGVSLEIVVRLFFYIVVFSLTNILFGYKSGGQILY